MINQSTKVTDILILSLGMGMINGWSKQRYYYKSFYFMFRYFLTYFRLFIQVDKSAGKDKLVAKVNSGITDLLGNKQPTSLLHSKFNNKPFFLQYSKQPNLHSPISSATNSQLSSKSTIESSQVLSYHPGFYLAAQSSSQLSSTQTPRFQPPTVASNLFPALGESGSGTNSSSLTCPSISTQRFLRSRQKTRQFVKRP